MSVIRAESPKSSQPKAAPWVCGLKIAKRPARAKALIINAFALAGRIVVWDTFTQGGALGYELIGLSARFV